MGITQGAEAVLKSFKEQAQQRAKEAAVGGGIAGFQRFEPKLHPFTLMAGMPVVGAALAGAAIARRNALREAEAEAARESKEKKLEGVFVDPSEPARAVPGRKKKKNKLRRSKQNSPWPRWEDFKIKRAEEGSSQSPPPQQEEPMAEQQSVNEQDQGMFEEAMRQQQERQGAQAKAPFMGYAPPFVPPGRRFVPADEAGAEHKKMRDSILNEKAGEPAGRYAAYFLAKSEGLAAEVDTLRRQVADLKGELKAAEMANNQFQAERMGQQMQVMQLVEERNRRSTQAGNELGLRERDLYIKEQEIEALQKEIDAKSKELAVVNEVLAEEKAACIRRGKEIRDLQNKLQERNEEIEYLKEKYEYLSSEKDFISAEIDRFKQDIKSLESKVSAAEGIEKHERERADLLQVQLDNAQKRFSIKEIIFQALTWGSIYLIGFGGYTLVRALWG